MGSAQSYPGLTEELLEEYASLTYLSKGEILYLMKKFYSMSPEKIDADFHHRFHKDEILAKFPVLRNNPFHDRLFRVFSSQRDNCFSFEDMVDLCSAMSAECPHEVKANWAFKIFDLDEDNQISDMDISDIIDRLTWDPSSPQNVLDKQSKKKIADVILKEIKLDGTSSIGINEFQIMLTKIPEFRTAFYFRL
ncbi:hypothetical protein JYU34_014289 [Plutella xylostella]|uniref:EF-hand domain-containing protein n=1 Tax=Plutella xylostella TaxID=51655 RepID=A0ABQ7Q8Z9_PLUXY|nr:calcium and integrin-binding family member 2 [Plutella xylostella]KAG7301353.1 hypothetical protein JYU34_014289 [Plutella xylostella]